MHFIPLLLLHDPGLIARCEKGEIANLRNLLAGEFDRAIIAPGINSGKDRFQSFDDPFLSLPAARSSARFGRARSRVVSGKADSLNFRGK